MCVGCEVIVAVAMKSFIFCGVCWKSTDVSKEHVAFIYMVEK
jgi:hypothetical protein